MSTRLKWKKWRETCDRITTEENRVWENREKCQFRGWA